MDRVTILTRSHVDADIPSSTVQSLLAPTLAHAVHLHRIVSSVSVSLLLNAYLAASVTLWASRVCVVHAWLATSFGVNMSGKAAAVAWDCRYVRAMRKRAFEECAAFILGSGNVLIVMAFWPGWWILGGTALAVSQLCG